MFDRICFVLTTPHAQELIDNYVSSLRQPRPAGVPGDHDAAAPRFPSEGNVFDRKLILGLQLPDRVGHGGLILIGVGQRQVREINLDRTLASKSTEWSLPSNLRSGHTSCTRVIRVSVTLGLGSRGFSRPADPFGKRVGALWAAAQKPGRRA